MDKLCKIGKCISTRDCKRDDGQRVLTQACRALLHKLRVIVLKQIISGKIYIEAIHYGGYFGFTAESRDFHLCPWWLSVRDRLLKNGPGIDDNGMDCHVFFQVNVVFVVECCVIL